MAVALVNHLVAPDDPDALLRLRAGARAPHPPRGAAGIRAVDPGPDRRGRQPRHPVHPARPALAGPARAGRLPAAHPGDDDLADLGDRGRRRVRQEPHQPAPRLGRAARPARRRRRHRGRRRGGRQRGSASRAWSSRSTATTAAASVSTCAPRTRSGLRSRRARPEPRRGRGGRVVRGRQRLPCLVIGGRSRPSPSACPASVTGDGEHTVRELVEIANSDPRRGIGHEKVLTRIKVDEAAEALVRKQGFAMDDGPARRDLGQARADRQHVDRRDVDRPDDRGASRQRRDRRDGGAGRRPRHRGHRLHLPRHRDPRPRDRRRDRGGQRRARVPDAHPPDRGRAAVRRPAGHRLAVPGGVARRASRSSR